MPDSTRDVVLVDRVYWTVLGTLGCDHGELDRYEQAVAAARAAIRTLDDTEADGRPAYSRAFVALRGVALNGSEAELRRFEVFPDRVVLVPEGQGGLSNAQAAVSERAARAHRDRAARRASDER